MAEAQKLHQATQKPARVFKDFHYRTRKSWSYERRVVGEAEYLAKGENPRFIVASIRSERMDARARTLREDFYCARGEVGVMENRIKERRLGLFADRTSTFLDAFQPTEALFFFVGLYPGARAASGRAYGKSVLADAQCDTVRAPVCLRLSAPKCA